MILYLLRHGQAVPSNGTITDSARSLSDQGRTDSEGVGRLLARLTPSVEKVLTSPLVRAVQTAENVSAAMPWHPAVSRSENLVPGFRQTGLLNELASLKEQHVLAVGHQPDLTGLISYLISGPALHLEMEPGSLAALTVTHRKEGHIGILHWLVSPMLIRSLNGNP